MPRRARPSGPNARSARSRKQRTARSSAPAQRDEGSPAPPRGPFVLGAIPGATPGKWIDAWQERMPRNPLELRALDVAEQRDALISGGVDAALVRLPIDRSDLHVIPLYDEVPVVATSADSHLTAADVLSPDDLVDEVLIIPGDDALGIRQEMFPGVATPAFDPPTTTEDAIATVATGVGIVIVPMSLARLHHRKDVAHRRLEGAPESTVALAWVADRTTPLVDAFVGIVRGRTANSSRS